jgi:hypothetical protein
VSGFRKFINADFPQRVSWRLTRGVFGEPLGSGEHLVAASRPGAVSARFPNLRVNYRIYQNESDTIFSNVMENCCPTNLREDRIDAT